MAVEVVDWANQLKGSDGRVLMSIPDSVEQLNKDGYVAFSLAPVLNYVPGVTARELFSSYSGEPSAAKPKEFRTGEFVLGYPVVTQCGEHGKVVHCMDKASYTWFKQWMLAMNFVNSVGGNFYTTRLCTCPVVDPFAWSHCKPKRGSALDVFTVATMKGTMVPKYRPLSARESAPLYVSFERREPDPEVVRIGRALLEKGRAR